MYQPEPQPFYGWAHNSATGERIGAATLEQWSLYWTLGGTPVYDIDGRPVYLVNAPTMLPCGHADHEHLSPFGRALLRATELVVCGMDDPADTELPAVIEIDLGDGLTDVERAALVALVGTLLHDWEVPARGMMLMLIDEGRPLPGVVLGHVLACARDQRPTHDNLIRTLSIMDDDDIAAIIACGATAAEQLKLHPDTLRTDVAERIKDRFRDRG